MKKCTADLALYLKVLLYQHALAQWPQLLLILPRLLYMYNGKGVLAFLVYSQMRLHHALPTQSMCGLSFTLCAMHIH